MSAVTAETVTVGDGHTPKVFRAGSGPTVVFLHAAGGVSDADPTLGALAQEYSVIAPLAPGFNDLTELKDIADVHDLAIYHDDLFESLGLEGVPVIGHSFGAMIAAELAAHYPSRVSKLVLIAPIGLWKDDEPVADLFGAPITEIGDLLWADPNGPGAVATKMAMESMQAADAEQIADMMIPMMQGFAAAAKFMWPIPEKGLAKRLRRITADTLLIWGAQDRLVPPSYAEEFARLIPSARIEVIEGAGHMAPVEAMDQVMAAVTKFLAA